MSLVPSLKIKLVRDFIGIEIYKQLDKKTRFIMIKYALEDFKREMIKKFGSLNKYQQYRLKNLGFSSTTDYKNFLAKRRGFDTCAKMYYFLFNYRKRNNRIEQGLCSICGKKSKEDYKVCEEHYEKNKKRRAEKREELNAYQRKYNKTDKRKIWEKQRYQDKKQMTNSLTACKIVEPCPVSFDVLSSDSQKNEESEKKSKYHSQMLKM